MNLLVLTGNLTKDFTVRNGVAKSSLAVNGFKGTMYVDLVAFKSCAENCAKYNHKGDLVLIEGSLDLNKYNDKIYTTCVINKISTLSAKPNVDDTPISVDDEPIGSDETIETIDTTDDDDLPF